jgi:5-methylcytosine-specific restriction endonuclease McrA
MQSPFHTLKRYFWSGYWMTACALFNSKPTCHTPTHNPRKEATMALGRCIVLNADSSFIHVTREPIDAVRLVLKGAATPVAVYPGGGARSADTVTPVPSVVQLRRYVRLGRRRPAFSFATKRNVLIRDQFRCAYCGRALTMGTATLEHVLPRCRGGRTTLENIVAACWTCNCRKDDLTPDEAGMRLMVQPRPLTDEEKLSAILKTHRSHERDAWVQALRDNGLTLF